MHLTFRDMEPSPAIEKAVRSKVDELEHIFDRITSCRVMVESPHQHQRKGRLFHVRIDLVVPGDELVIGRNPGERHAHEDFAVALRDSFRAARRVLREHARRRRGEIKAHSAPQVAATTLVS